MSGEVAVGQRKLLEALATFGAAEGIPDTDRPAALIRLGQDCLGTAQLAIEADNDDLANVMIALAGLVGAVATERQEMCHGHQA